MKIFAALALFAMFSSEPKVYPIHVRLLRIHVVQRDGYAWGEGQGNVMEEGKQPHGFDFTYKSCEPFDAAGAYTGRWVGNSKSELVILRSDIPGKSVHECIFNTIMKDVTYLHQDGKLMMRPLPKEDPAPKN